MNPHTNPDDPFPPLSRSDHEPRRKYEFVPEDDESVPDRVREIRVSVDRTVKVRRIRLLPWNKRDCLDNRRGTELGGFLEREDNLSHAGNCWVTGDAIVMGEARVRDEALVGGESMVYERAIVSGKSVVEGRAQVYGDCSVSGHAFVAGHARVLGSTQVYGNAFISGNATVGGSSWVHGNAHITGTSIVTGTAAVFGTTRLGGTERIDAGWLSRTPVHLSGFPEPFLSILVGDHFVSVWKTRSATFSAANVSQGGPAGTTFHQNWEWWLCATAEEVPHFLLVPDASGRTSWDTLQPVLLSLIAHHVDRTATAPDQGPV